MAKTTPSAPDAPATVVVTSTITIGGLNPGQVAEVDANEFTRSLVAQGLWIVLAPPEPAAPVAAAEEPSEDL